MDMVKRKERAVSPNLSRPSSGFWKQILFVPFIFFDVRKDLNSILYSVLVYGDEGLDVFKNSRHQTRYFVSHICFNLPQVDLLRVFSYMM